LKLAATIGQYRQFFIDNDFNRKDVTIIEMNQAIKRIQNPLVKFGCVMSILVDPLLESEDTETVELVNKISTSCKNILESYIVGEIELSEIEKESNEIIQYIERKFIFTTQTVDSVTEQL
jgi:hypothetical protein